MLAVVVNMNGAGIRGLGGWAKQSFKLGSSTLTLKNKAINLLIVAEDANWGRLTHEVAHNIVSVPVVSAAKTENENEVHGEDIYRSDLVDPDMATAADFDLMGHHDSHPLFSGFHLDRLGWYRPDNPGHTGDIRELQWTRNPFSESFEVVAHGLARNSAANRFHLLKIVVSKGLALLRAGAPAAGWWRIRPGLR